MAEKRTGIWARMVGTLKDFLPTPIRRENEVETYTAGLFGLSVMLVLFGLAVVIVAPLLRRTVADAISTGVVGLLSALMCLAAGAVLGLLFGIPRYSRLTDVGNAIAPNNNLEQISDWLTKMIVGISLVQFDVIVRKTKVLAQQISAAMMGCPAPCPENNYAMGLAVIGFFSAAGFLMMYLWARIYLLLDVGQVQIKIDTDAAQAQKSYYKKDEATDRLSEFWMPDGSTINQENEKKLREWMKGNGLENTPIATLINAEEFAPLRKKAAKELLPTGG